MSYTILVVDDNDSIRHTIAYYLRDHGHTVFTEFDALSGYMTWNKRSYSDTPYDIVISDVHMPEVTGWAMRDQIRATCRDRGIQSPHFIMMSGEDVGADLIKPFKYDPELDMQIAKIDRIRESARKLEEAAA